MTQERAIAALVEAMKEPYKSTFLWLLDLIVDVANLEQFNEMSIRNITSLCCAANQPTLTTTVVLFAPHMHPPPPEKLVKRPEVRDD